MHIFTTLRQKQTYILQKETPEFFQSFQYFLVPEQVNGCRFLVFIYCWKIMS